MDNLDFIKLNVLRVAPKQSQDKVVSRRDRLVSFPEEYVQKVLHAITQSYIYIYIYD